MKSMKNTKREDEKPFMVKRGNVQRAEIHHISLGHATDNAVHLKQGIAAQ